MSEKPSFGTRLKRFFLAQPTEYPVNYPANIIKLPPDPDWMAKSPLDKPGGNPDIDQGNPKTLILHTQRIGSTGTISFSGYPAEDYLNTVRGKHKANVYDHMRRSDTQVKMCLNSVKNPIRSAVWDIDAVNDSPEEQEIKEFVEYVLFKAMDKPFDKFISEALTCIDFGHSVFEMTDKVVLDDPLWGDFIGIRDLGFISPKTIERWNLDPQTDKLANILQLAWGDTSRFVEIPGDFLLVFSIDREGSNYEGISMLRPCYGSWFRKDLYLKLNAIGIEKFAIPTAVADVPDGKQNSDQYRSLITALENYATHQQAYFTKPAGWVVDFKNNTYDPQKVEASIDNEDKRMVKAFLANFLELGMGSSSGNRALGDSLKAFFLGGIQYLANELCSEINLTMIPRIVRMNYGERPSYPKLKASGIADQAGEEFSKVLKNLADSQYITPDDPTEEHLRKRVGLPPMSDIGQRAVKSVGAAGVDGPANPNFQQLSEKIRAAERRRKALWKK